jgi:hypothetical protein
MYELRAIGFARPRPVSYLLMIWEESSNNEILRHALPITLEAWRHALAQLLSKPTNEYTYLAATGGYIKIDAGDIGEHRVPLLHPKVLSHLGAADAADLAGKFVCPFLFMCICTSLRHASMGV